MCPVYDTKVKTSHIVEIIDMYDIRILTLIDTEADVATIFAARMADDWKITIKEALGILMVKEKTNDLNLVIDEKDTSIDEFVNKAVEYLKKRSIFWFNESYCFETYCI